MRAGPGTDTIPGREHTLPRQVSTNGPCMMGLQALGTTALGVRLHVERSWAFFATPGPHPIKLVRGTCLCRRDRPDCARADLRYFAVSSRAELVMSRFVTAGGSHCACNFV